MRNNPKQKIEKPKAAIETPKLEIGQPRRKIETPEPTIEQPTLPGVFTMALRRPRLVLGMGLLFALLAVGLAAILPFSYQATARLYVDPRGLNVVDNPLTPASETRNIAVTLVESQALVLDSDSLRMQTVKKLGLAKDPEFNGQPRTFIGALVARVAGAPSTPQDRAEIALDKLARAVSIYRIDRSYVILVSAKAETGAKARAIVDSLVTNYLDDQSRWQAELARRSSRDLSAGIKPLRENVDAWERRVTRYKEKHNLIGVLGRIVTEQEFADLNAKLNLARVEAATLKARFDATPLQASELGQVPEAVGSTTMGNLRVLLARVRQRKANLQSRFGPRHPVMRSVGSSERQVTQQVDAELARIRASIAIAYQRARSSAAALAKKREDLGAKVTKTNAAQIGLRELERQLGAAQSVYNQAITRAKEASQQARLDTTNVRVISPARREQRRAFPPPLPLVAVIGFLLGTILTLFWLHLRGMLRQSRAG